MLTKQTPTKVSSDPFATKLSDPANECASHLQNMDSKYVSNVRSGGCRKELHETPRTEFSNRYFFFENVGKTFSYRNFPEGCIP